MVRINYLIMKKQTSFLTLLLMLTAVVLHAQNRETRNVGPFTKIVFRVPGKVLLRQGDTQKVEIEGKKDILEKIETQVEGSKLVIEKEGKWNDWKWNDDDRVTVYITVKELEGISVSGSGDVIGESRFTTGDLELSVSGSGSLKLEANASGDVEADVSGSGDLYLKGQSKSFESDVTGSGKINISMTVSGLADFQLSGSGKVEASGTANMVKASITGSGRVMAADMEAKRCQVRISGSGDVEINVKEELDADITGSGSVNYKGNPSKVNSHASGSGKVRKM